MPSACARRARSRVAKLWAAAVGPPAETKGKGAALASKAAPEGAVETDYGLTSPGKICRVYGYQQVNILNFVLSGGRAANVARSIAA
jgi:hypothetical protein